jgi:hypothetical protein
VALLLLPLFAQPLTAEPALPLVEDAEFAVVRDDCERLLKALESLKAALPADVAQKLRAILKDGAKDRQAVEKVQALLDARCLCAVSINPESRVKAARGPWEAVLTKDLPSFVLIKIHNDAGVTANLRVEGPQIRDSAKKAPERWLDADVPSAAGKLSGHKLQYVVLRLTAREAGKREATLRFDVGQGTQDLGFRAEVPILFTVGARQ